MLQLALCVVVAIGYNMLHNSCTLVYSLGYSYIYSYTGLYQGIQLAMGYMF